MRTISALITATLCALALSGSAFAVDRKQGPMSAPNPGWLEFRTVIAAEDFGPAKVFTTKSGRAQSTVHDADDKLWPASLDGTASAALRRGLDVLRTWGTVAERVLANDRASFDIAGN